jgi:methylmalonyl-CoA mutase
MEQADNLFADFSPASFEAWLKKAAADLKGEHPNTLVTNLLDGTTIQPYYTSETAPHPSAPLSKGTLGWLIGETIPRMPEKEANQMALDMLSAGVSALAFEVDQNTDFTALLRDILIEYIDLRLVVKDGQGVVVAKKFFDEVDTRGLDRKQLQGAFCMDIYGQLAETGNWQFDTCEKDESALENLLLKTQNCGMHGAFVDGTVYQQAGASPSLELAAVMAHAHEYLMRFPHTSLPIKVHMVTGNDFFMEIAKFRAIRQLWAFILENYGLPIQPLQIYAGNSIRNKSIYDPYVNMLRTTAESLSAIIGGANVVQTMAYDHTFRNPSSFARRIARNQQLLMQYESYFDKVADPGAGAYFIESLTKDLCERAWKYFQSIEATGGLKEALRQGWLQNKIKEQSEEAQAAFDDGRLVLVGVNKFEKKDEAMSEKLERIVGLYQEVFTVNRPMPPKRLAHELESLRLASESKTH